MEPPCLLSPSLEYDWDTDRVDGLCCSSPGETDASESIQSDGVRDHDQALSSLGLLPSPGSGNRPMLLNRAASYGPPRAAYSESPACFLERYIRGYDPQKGARQRTIREIKASRQREQEVSRAMAPSGALQSNPGSTILPPEIWNIILEACVHLARFCPRCQLIHKMKVTHFKGMRMWGIGPLPVMFSGSARIYQELTRIIYPQIAKARITGRSVGQYGIGGQLFDLRPVQPLIGKHVTSVSFTFRVEGIVDMRTVEPCPLSQLLQHLTENYTYLNNVHLRLNLACEMFPVYLFQKMRCFNQPGFKFTLEVFLEERYHLKSTIVKAATKISRELAEEINRQWHDRHRRPMLLLPFSRNLA